jgi:hypothetical protein
MEKGKHVYLYLPFYKNKPTRLFSWVVTHCGFVSRDQRFGETYLPPSSGLPLNPHGLKAVSEYLCNIIINEDVTYIQYCINSREVFSERSDPILYRACATMLCDPAPMYGFLLLRAFTDSEVGYASTRTESKKYL